MTTQFYQNSIFWVEVEKIKPNPFQPRREFDEEHLRSLADSIRQYGVLQALVVTRKEVPKEDGGLSVEYELVSGERRLRAADKAGVKQVPVLIKTGEESDLMKLELAIIENVQREDLNVVERARAFQRLNKEFGISHSQIAKRVGKSREFVSNTLRMLAMPNEILDALSDGRLAEGHARPLMMLNDKPEEQSTLFKEIVYKKHSVREAERIATRIAHDKVRKKQPEQVDPELRNYEKEFTQSLGTRVHIEKREVGGRLSIDFFSQEDLRNLLELIRSSRREGEEISMLERYIAEKEANASVGDNDKPSVSRSETGGEKDAADLTAQSEAQGGLRSNDNDHYRNETETPDQPLFSRQEVDQETPAQTNGSLLKEDEEGDDREKIQPEQDHSQKPEMSFQDQLPNRNDDSIGSTSESSSFREGLTGSQTDRSEVSESDTRKDLGSVEDQRPVSSLQNVGREEFKEQESSLDQYPVSNQEGPSEDVGNNEEKNVADEGATESEADLPNEDDGDIYSVSNFHI